MHDCKKTVGRKQKNISTNVRLLVLTCGTSACYHVCRILKEKFPGKFYIVGTDINKQWMIPAGNYLDQFYQCPLSSDSSYYQFIIDICRHENIDYLLPSFDLDQFLFYKENKNLDEIGVKSLGISQALSFYKDKIETNRYLKKLGIPVPHFYSKASIVPDEIYFVKPIHGVGSIGARTARGIDVINKLNIDDYIIQEVCFNPEYTLECFNYKGKIFSVARQRLASKAGVCTKARIFKSKTLENYAKLFISKVEVPYIFNMQFMKNNKGKFVCTDLNLRTAGGMSLSYAAGWDEVSALGNIMLDKRDEEVLKTVSSNISEQYIVRAFQDVVTKKIKENIAFDLDGTLLDSRVRHQKVMEFILSMHNIHIDCSDFVSYKAKGHNTLSWLRYKGLDETIVKDLNKEWIQQIEEKHFLKYDRLYDYTIPILKKYSKNRNLFLITARNNSENAIVQIKQLGIIQFFCNVFVIPSNSETPQKKANLIKENNISEMVGDTESDYLSSKLSGCKFTACLHGFRTKEFLDNKIGSYKILC